MVYTVSSWVLNSDKGTTYTIVAEANFGCGWIRYTGSVLKNNTGKLVLNNAHVFDYRSDCLAALKKGCPNCSFTLKAKIRINSDK